MFGNPFKINKNLMMTDEIREVDEVQLVCVGGVGGHQGVAGRGVKRPDLAGPPAPPKRRKGALPKDFQYVSPSSSPCPSPAHSVEYSDPPSPLPPPPPSPAPASSPAPAPASVPSVAPAPPRHLSNGVSVPGGLGPVYPGGKMAAFKSLCDADLDNDCDEPLVIADTSAPESITLVHLDDNEEDQDEEEEEEIVELPVPVENHVVKHPAPPGPQERKPPSNT